MTITIRHYVPEEDTYQYFVYKEIDWFRTDAEWLVIMYDKGTDMDKKYPNNFGVYYHGFDQELDELTVC